MAPLCSGAPDSCADERVLCVRVRGLMLVSDTWDAQHGPFSFQSACPKSPWWQYMRLFDEHTGMVCSIRLPPHHEATRFEDQVIASIEHSKYTFLV
jgi:hypothetical protein